ncbi:hypothetical protein Tco_0561879 [Tanacetum coccineum]
MISYRGDLYKLLLVQVMDAPNIPVSTKENLGDPIVIRVDIIHPEPVAAVAFPAAAVMRTQVQHGEAIRGILEHLQGVPIEEEMSTLRFRMGMVEVDNASLRGKIKTMEAIKTVTRSQEKRARIEMERQLASVQEVMEKGGSVAYKLEMPQELSRVHHTFHVSKLKKCYTDEPLAVPLDGLHIDDKLYFFEEPAEIIDQETCSKESLKSELKQIRYKDQVLFDEQEVIRLQAQFDEEERIVREKEEANDALIAQRNDIQDKVETDYELAQRLQAEGQEELIIKENSKMFQQLLEKRRKHFAAKRAE